MKQLTFDILDPEALKRVPLQPGCYLFKDAAGTILYVGKAKALRKRLASYLNAGAQKPDKTMLMLKKAACFEIIITVSEKEALILEAELIRKHRPKYNVHWRDDKAYPFLRLGIKATYPRLSVVRRRRRDGALYYGPYASAKSVREALRFVSSTFGLRTCTDHVMKTRSRPCLQFQIDRCSAPCCSRIGHREYLERVEQVRLFLEGKTGHLIKELTAQMKEEAAACAFEKAAVLRDRITAIRRISEAQTVVAGMDADWDLIGLARESSNVCMGVLRVREGIVQGQEIHFLNAPVDEPDEEVISFFIRHFYMDVMPPSEIITACQIPDKVLLEQLLSDAASGKVQIKWSVRTQRARLLKMAQDNARAALAASRRKEEEWNETGTALKEFLNIDTVPEYIEGLDISNTGGLEPVGSLVAFVKGRPCKERYRQFNIKGMSGPDDYESLRQMMRRRIEAGGLPDMFLIDGGRGQLSAVAGVVTEEAGLKDKPVLALAKDRGSGPEKIFVHGEAAPRILPNHHPVLLFLQKVRDEAHRFAVSRHRKRRHKRSLATQLTSIPGVGPARQRALLNHFGSLKRLKEASRSEIESVPAIPRSLARVIHEHLRNKPHG